MPSDHQGKPDPLPADAATVAPSKTHHQHQSAGDAADLLDCFGETPGTMIGRYKLLQRIGEGGFGTVYVAEQQHPVTRRVALKIIKLGMDTKQVIARFEAERQALALMDHPNIAKVLDAGATDTGRPYFVMELVRGVPITEYCDRHHLTVRQRIELLVPVCQAIQHAHQKGIIHRDIKPSNVLISVHDGKPVPKVIDFGIAKAINQRLTEQTLFTEYNQMIGTPEYMSPEQAEFSGLDVDTRTDLYSLGVLMYELLTSVTPFDTRTLRSGSYADIQRMIREVDPPRPSTRLSTLQETLWSIAARRRVEPRNLASSIRGELDWIVMKCLEKDRTRRYESADALGQDLARYLTDQPVLAGPPSTSYRLRKLVRRNRVAVTVSGVVALVLVIASVVSTAQAIRATRAERQAQANADRADREATNAKAEAAKQAAVTRFFNDMLASANPRLLAMPGQNTRHDITVLRALHEAGAKLDAGQLADQPEIQAAVRSTIGQTYRSLGDYDAAARHLRTALEIHRRLHGQRHPDVAASLDDLGVLLQAQGKGADAEPLLRQALALRREMLDPKHPDLATSLNNLGSLLWTQGKLSEAESIYNEALSLRRQVLPADHPLLPATINNLASVLHAQGKYDPAEPLYREALEAQRRILGEDHVDVATGLINLAALLRTQGKWADAEPLYRQALALRRKHLPPEHPDIAMAANALGLLLWTQGNFAEAEPLYRQALAIQRKQFDGAHPEIASTLNNLATLLWSQGKSAEAEALYRQALQMQRQLMSPKHVDIATTLNNLGSVLHVQGKFDQAEPAYREALSIWRERGELDRADVATVLNNLGSLVEAQGNIHQAAALYRQALEMQRRLLGADHPDLSTTLNNLAAVLEELGNSDDAEAHYRHAIAIDRTLGQADHPHLAGSLSNFALVLQAQGRFDEAEPLVREALSIRQRALPPGHWQRASSATLLGEILLAQNKLDEAEPLLLEGYEGLRDNPFAPLPRRRVAIEANLALAHARADKESVAKLQAALDEFNRRHPPTSPSATRPAP